MTQLNPITQIFNSFHDKCTLILDNENNGYKYYNDDAKRMLDSNVAPWQIKSMLKKSNWKLREE